MVQGQGLRVELLWGSYGCASEKLLKHSNHFVGLIVLFVALVIDIVYLCLVPPFLFLLLLHPQRYTHRYVKIFISYAASCKERRDTARFSIDVQRQSVKSRPAGTSPMPLGSTVPLTLDQKICFLLRLVCKPQPTAQRNPASQDCFLQAGNSCRLSPKVHKAQAANGVRPGIARDRRFMKCLVS